jgi:hypothetical protein
LPIELPTGPAIPLSRWADRQLRILATETGSARIAALDGAALIGERGSHGNYINHGRISAGLGGSRLSPTRDSGWIALTILRAEDRELLHALFMDEDIDVQNNDAIAAAIAKHDAAELVERGRLLGLPISSANEAPPSPPVEVLVRGPHRQRAPGHRPLVIDLSAIWAGPLAGHLLWLAGADVVKVENPKRPDLIRRDDPQTFEIVNQGKANVAVDFYNESEKAALIALIRQADMVIESSRVRALKQLGIDADQLVRETPGLVWLSVTGHGATGEQANWAGIGHDCGVAAGLTRAMAELTGVVGYVGDALPDPLTGITAAIEGWRAYKSGQARRIGFALSSIGAHALQEEREYDPAALEAELHAWADALGQPFPKSPPREVLAETRALGADTDRWLTC